MIAILNEPMMRAGPTDVSGLHRGSGTFVAWARGNPEWGTAIALRGYVDEKNAFLALLPSLRSTHAGEYVAVANGEVVVRGGSRRDVTRRYFADRRGPVYIGFVGPRRVVRQASPFRSRSNASLS